eukprot:s2832_g6.t2
MAPHLFGYKVATRPFSAPFQRAKCPENVASTPLWRSLPGRKPGQRQGSCSPRLKPLGPEPGRSQEGRARSASPASTEAEAEDAADPGKPEKRVVSAREWHVSDQQIQRLVERLQTEETPSAPCAARLRPVASPSQVNRPLLCCGRLKRPKEPPEATPESSVDTERDQWAARAAREDYEAREAERIKYYFRKTESDAMASSQEMARCASAPSRGRRKETQQVAAEAGRKKLPKSKSEVLVTLNFMDTGDKYTLQVDPDLRIGPCAETTGLKGIIEEITGVPAPNQILFCKRCKMGNDRHTLRSYHAHDNAEVLVRFKPERSKFPQACTVKWRQQQQLRSQRRERAREYCVSQQAQQAQHRIQPCWQRCVVPQNGTFFQYAKRGIEGKLAQRFDLHWNGQAADIRTNLFHDPFSSFGDYHTFRPDEHSREWERIRSGPAYTTKLEFES